MTKRHSRLQLTYMPFSLGLFKKNSKSIKGTNGDQIPQLWQFLLEILTDKNYANIIHWVDGEEGEFCFKNPHAVSMLWGKRKKKPSMTYEKLTRALRYYYEGDMLAKVANKRCHYRFVCDLQTVIGYSAADLARLVKQSPLNKSCTQLVDNNTSVHTIATTKEIIISKKGLKTKPIGSVKKTIPINDNDNSLLTSLSPTVTHHFCSADCSSNSSVQRSIKPFWTKIITVEKEQQYDNSLTWFTLNRLPIDNVMQNSISPITIPMKDSEQRKSNIEYILKDLGYKNNDRSDLKKSSDYLSSLTSILHSTSNNVLKSNYSPTNLRSTKPDNMCTLYQHNRHLLQSTIKSDSAESVSSQITTKTIDNLIDPFRLNECVVDGNKLIRKKRLSMTNTNSIKRQKINSHDHGDKGQQQQQTINNFNYISFNTHHCHHRYYHKNTNEPESVRENQNECTMFQEEISKLTSSSETSLFLQEVLLVNS